MDNFSHNAYWIGAGKVIVSKVVNYESPATELRREFILEKQPEKAVCVICGLGAYELFLNGQKVNDDLLSPGFTMYDRRVLYLTYSVEKYLKAGINVVGVRLGDGFFQRVLEGYPKAAVYPVCGFRRGSRKRQKLEREYGGGMLPQRNPDGGVL